MKQDRNDQAPLASKYECPKTSDNIRPKKITRTDWIALIIAYLISFYVAQSIILRGAFSFVLGATITLTIVSLGATFLISRKVSIGISALLGFAIICFFNSGQIYSQARNAGLAPKDASLRKNIFFILITLLAWGLYWGLRYFLKSRTKRLK